MPIPSTTRVSLSRAPIDKPMAAKGLREAAALINQDGWTVGVMVGEHGEHCTMGALIAAGDSGYDAIRAFHAYMKADPERFAVPIDRSLYGTATDAITGWNDSTALHSGRVIEALNDAATWIEGRPADA